MARRRPEPEPPRRGGSDRRAVDGWTGRPIDEQPARRRRGGRSGGGRSGGGSPDAGRPEWDAPATRPHDPGSPDGGSYDPRPYAARPHETRPHDRTRPYDDRGHTDRGGADRGHSDRDHAGRGHADRGGARRPYDDRGGTRDDRTRPYDDRGDDRTRSHDRTEAYGDRAGDRARAYERGPGGAGAYPGDVGPGMADGPGAPGWQPPRKITATRVAASRTRYLVGAGARRIGAASRADGAEQSGLTRLIWAHAAHYTADAMIAVCLAGTVFFSAARSEQRLQVGLYLLVTMAPFALVAPFIGPALDRLQRGRRMALAATAIGRAVLVWIMAAQFDNGFALYPAAFGALVLSKAYAVLRGACLPRMLPAGMTLVSANARLSMFGLGAAAVGGGLLAGFINVSDSYPWALRITAAVCVVAAVLSLRLPATVDSAEGEEEATVVRSDRRGKVWQGAALGIGVVTALRAAASLRALSGFLTLFLAFYIQATETGTAAAVALGGLVAAAAGGQVVGTAIGARMTPNRPDPILIGAIGLVAGVCVVAALTFSLTTAIAVAAAAGIGNALGKLCLDAIIQRDVPDSLRASAFARSETMLQLAWVGGGGLGIALPSNGPIGFGVSGALLVIACALTIIGRRRSLRPRRRPAPEPTA